MSQPIAEIGDRADFMGWVAGSYPYPGRSVNMVGTVVDVIEGAIHWPTGVQFEHQYRMETNDGKRYRIAESDLSTPYGKEGYDD
jgi:hypothetical protein